MDVDLSVDFCGIKFKNPVLVASGTFGYGVEYKGVVDLNKLGGIVFKSVTVNGLLGNEQPRIYELPFGLVNSIGLENKGIQWLKNEVLPQLEDVDTELIPSIYGFSFEEYVELLKQINDVKRFRIVEVNISCPNVRSIIHRLERDIKIFSDFVHLIRRATTKILVVKMGPLIYNMVDFAKVLVSAGINGISLINTIPVVVFDWKSRKSNLGTFSGGLSGPPLKPISQKLCIDIYREVDIPVIGIGGVMKAEDIVEYICCGAKLVEIGTANFIKPDISERCVEEIEQICRKENIESLKKLCGAFVWGNDKNRILKIYTDGASSGNPGPSSCAFVLKNQDDDIIMKRAFFLGHSTNNVAEYTALVKALEFLEERRQFLNYVREIHIFSDSELLLRQLKGSYKIKDEKLKPLSIVIHNKLKSLNKPFSFFEISREENKEADKLCREKLVFSKQSYNLNLSE